MAVKLSVFASTLLLSTLLLAVSQEAGEFWHLMSPTGEAIGVRAESVDRASTQPTSEDSTSSLSQGVFTEAQAERGQRVVTGHCAACHGATLTGGQFGGPPLRGTYFFGRWEGQTVADLYSYTRQNMPANRPNSLTPEQYIDSIAYVLQVNGYPPGEVELTSEIEMLEQLIIEAPEED